MTGDITSYPPDIRSLNSTFYQKNGPAEYILMRLYNLVIVGGAYSAHKDILIKGVEYADCRIRLKSDDELTDDEASQSDTAFREHFLRIESHHLKHLAIETLIRLFLGHRDKPRCPWLEISRVTNPAEFKKAVRRHIVNASPADLQTDVMETVLGVSPFANSTVEEQREIGHNLATLLRSFTEDWLAEANSYNATKHGLTAVPGDAHFALGPQGEELTALGYGDSLTHLTYDKWRDNKRVWSHTVRWIRIKQAIATIANSQLMIKSLWSVARVCYGIETTGTVYYLPPSVFSIDDLYSMDESTVRELKLKAFVEDR